MRKAMRFAMVALMAVSLCACAKTTDTKETATPAPTDASQPTATPTPTATPKEEGTAFGHMNAKLRIADVFSKEITDLDYDKLDDLYYSLDVALVTFPSTNHIKEDRFVEAKTEEELLGYINEHNNIWNTKEDKWTFEKKNFSHGHDVFYNIQWRGKKDIHYFIIDAEALYPQEAYEIDDDMLYYDEGKKTLYLFYNIDFTYKDYVSMTDKISAEKIDKEAVSNRCVLALNYKDDGEIKEIVFVVPPLRKNIQ